MPPLADAVKLSLFPSSDVGPEHGITEQARVGNEGVVGAGSAGIVVDHQKRRGHDAQLPIEFGAEVSHGLALNNGELEGGLENGQKARSNPRGMHHVPVDDAQHLAVASAGSSKCA